MEHENAWDKLLQIKTDGLDEAELCEEIRCGDDPRQRILVFRLPNYEREGDLP